MSVIAVSLRSFPLAPHEAALRPDTTPVQNADTLSGSSLSSRLAEPLSSTNELLDLLIPPLESLALLPDQPSLAERHTRSPIPFSAERFARRQLGLVQKILIEKVWPEWESALEAEEGAAGLAVFERFFVPPPSAFASTSSNVRSTGADVAISAYAVLSTTTSGKTVAALPRRSVEIAVDLLAKLSTRFNIEELYLATLGAPKATTHVGRAEAQDEDDVADPAAVARWETCQRLLLSVPTRAANAWGSTLSEGQKIVAPFPQDLHPECVASVVMLAADDELYTQNFRERLRMLSRRPHVATSRRRGDSLFPLRPFLRPSVNHSRSRSRYTTRARHSASSATRDLPSTRRNPPASTTAHRPLARHLG